MKKVAVAAVVIFTASFLFFAAGNGATNPSMGEQAFLKHCAVCHPDGGNIINSAKTLHQKVREANGVKTTADIVKNMRNPGPGMTPFDKKAVDDKTARAIADYILKTFK